MSIAPEFRTKILRRASSPDEYKVYRAALEWDLTDPIVMESADDFKSSSRWQGRVTPYHHQVTNLITFCRRLPVTLLADDVGLGKTVSAGLIMSELIARARVSKILIVCPKLLGPQWQAELDQKFDITASVATGRELLAADAKETGAVITTYNSARLYLDKLRPDRFQMLVLDEAHKLRNLYGGANAPKVATKFREALEARRFPYVLMLTATPIQNRLWDLYSLVDLLTVARGHENPFGKEGMFARRFIADQASDARQLKPESQQEFRSIVYGYMSRVRRGDANLLFPERVVQMHRVDPTPAELALIRAIAGPIQSLNRLVQISILQALASSPDALLAQLNNMANNQTVPPEMLAAVRKIVTGMPRSAKLTGLGRLVEQLQRDNPDGWRLVVFTGRRETQTTIQNFLEGIGLDVGIINGSSGPRNQTTIAQFWADPPRLRVIVSTEAGSEGVNLQVANVLVNFDLPWNPMIVEQRIGRVQRLGSAHANVSILNIMLKGTFEEYIVGRLMEKLQMASHAIGDIESLLEGADIGDGESDAAASFEDRILSLVLATLAGKDVEEDIRRREQSIRDAKAELEREEANINAMLGSMDGAEYVGPRVPNLPTTPHSMSPMDFTLAALPLLGSRVSKRADPDRWIVEHSRGSGYIHFPDHSPGHPSSVLYAPGSPPFQRLVSQMVATGIHAVEDVDPTPRQDSEQLVRAWIDSLGAHVTSIEVANARRLFHGAALLRVRATVAHDSYERLVEVPCAGATNRASGTSALAPLTPNFEDPGALGLDSESLIAAARNDEAVAEFSRFYLERREQEKPAAGADLRKREKLHEEFTPRLQATLAGLQGTVHREVSVRARYRFDTETEFENVLTIVPRERRILDEPALDVCMRSGRVVPVTCLDQCAISGDKVLRNFLVQSAQSGRRALPEFAVNCAFTGNRVLRDEAEPSAITGKLVSRSLLRSSALSGRRAEPEFFTRCAFTNSEVLADELSTSEISSRPYRVDEGARSAVSGKKGHKSEFLTCQVTQTLMAASEAETCEATGAIVRPGVLSACQETGKRVLPGELGQCAVTDRFVLKRLLVYSSLSGSPLLRSVAIRSSKGLHCLPAETGTCAWSGAKAHPDDLLVCQLTGLRIHKAQATEAAPPRLRTLVELLDGTLRSTDDQTHWDLVASRMGQATEGKTWRIEAATRSPNGHLLAFVGVNKLLFGLRTNHGGGVFNTAQRSVVGRVVQGKRTAAKWQI